MTNIIYCADGTRDWPGTETMHRGDRFPTNVFKLFSNLASAHDAGDIRLAEEQERSAFTAGGELVQRAKYIHGVGASSNPIVELLGLGLGIGLIAQIVRGYTFISRNYAPGDRIFLIGFSRGAYAVRALSGLIAAKGLLDRTRLGLDDKTGAYRLAIGVWYAYQHELLKQNKVDLLGRLENFVADLPSVFLRPPTVERVFPVEIDTIAVWETVGSLGFPEFSKTMGELDLFHLADTRLSANVKRGIHAVSLDEQQAVLTPTLWDADPRVTQVLFPGTHEDVGGGHPTTGNESGLSDGALAWIMTQLPALRFSSSPSFRLKPDALGVAHRPWLEFPWRDLPVRPRAFDGTLIGVAPAVEERINGGPVRADPTLEPKDYRPLNLPSV